MSLGRFAVFGLAGKSSAGKDTLLPVFVEKGFTVVDGDALGHQALVACADAVTQRFGTSDRRELSALLFRRTDLLPALEAITYPWIEARVLEAIAGAPGPVVINAALLAKLPLSARLDAVVWVTAPLWTRLRRARRRDRRPWRALWGRVWAQRKLRAQDFSPTVDIHIVENPARPEQAQAALRGLLDRLMSVFPERKP